MKRPTLKPAQSTDFDVISGPSLASACPIVEDATSDPELATQSDAKPMVVESADAA